MLANVEIAAAIKANRNTMLRPSTPDPLALRMPAMIAVPVMLPRYLLVENSPIAEPVSELRADSAADV